MAPGYRVEDSEKCTEQEQPPGALGPTTCVPASKPWCCPQKSWDVVKNGTSGIEFCDSEAPPNANPDPCDGETNWNGNLCF